MPRFSAYPVLERLPALRMSAIRRHMPPGADASRPGRLELHTPGGSVTVRLDATPQPFGGVRWWMRCPSCGDRRTVLYYWRSMYRCQRCHGLPYRSQRATDQERWARQAAKLWDRIAVVDEETGWRNKRPWIRWSTFNRLADRAEEYERKADAVLLRALCRVVDRCEARR